LTPLLSVHKVSKSFGDVRVLKEVSFELHAGQIHALCGENGAGKSTLMKILSGVYPEGSYSGEVFVEGRSFHSSSTRDSMTAGIAIVYQELSLIPNLTACENMFLGHERTRAGLLDEESMLSECKSIFARIRLQISPRQLVEELSVGQSQLVEIAKALRFNPKILILDEPTTGLSETETETLFAVLRELKAQGMGVIIITHKLAEVFEISDRITVLRDGATIKSWATGDTSEPQLIESMVGRPMQEHFPTKKARLGNEVVMRVRNWTVPRPRRPGQLAVDGVSFDLYRGEILGVSGLMGAGRSELLLSLFGALPVQSGELILFDRPVRARSPRAAFRNGLALVSEDRKQLGLVVEADVVSNVTLSSLHRYSRAGLVQGQKELSKVKGYVNQLSIKTASLRSLVKTLSGGNQQKVVLAKCLDVEPKILLMDEPTRGIDVGARYEIYQLIRDWAAQGGTVLLASSDMMEILGMCHRVMVLCDGRLTGTFEQPSEKEIMAAATRFRTKVMESEA